MIVSNIFILASRNCKINKLEAVGCRKDRKAGSECKIRRAENATFSFNFTPDFEGSDISLVIYSTAPVDAAWPEMDGEACKFMTCPLQKNVPTNYTYSQYIRPQYPKVRFFLGMKIFLLLFTAFRDSSRCDF